jgi:hypothetical protein
MENHFEQGIHFFAEQFGVVFHTIPPTGSQGVKESQGSRIRLRSMPIPPTSILDGIAGLHRDQCPARRTGRDDITGSSVITRLMKYTSLSTLCIMVAVVSLWHTLPLRRDSTFYGRTVHGLVRFQSRARSRAEGIEAFPARPLDVAFLQIARGHIVQAGIAEYDIR